MPKSIDDKIAEFYEEDWKLEVDTFKLSIRELLLDGWTPDEIQEQFNEAFKEVIN